MTWTWPDLASLELFTAVAEEGSLSAGARRVGMAQPNASRAMARLEQQLGVALLDRRTGGSRPTAAGAELLRDGQAVLLAARALLDRAGALGTERRGHLRVGASLTVAEYLMPGWLTAFKRIHPDVQVELDVENSGHIFGQVAQGHADVGFVESPNIPAGLRRLVVAADRLAVVVAPDHAWARRGTPLAAADLAAAPLVVREPGSGTRLALERALDRALPGRGQLRPALELRSNAAVRIAVAAGAGAAVLSDFAVRTAVERGELVEVPVAGLRLERRIRAVWKGARVLDGMPGELVTLAGAGYTRSR
ncbi:LysR substrate-binding domain-containing protein [Arthrobacter sp. SDTb3-6]|uniref:LysR substrate-binding domain-containing protein n=1 Tax=Arthrobacter sp. SDTb3-6 TaxID=2713571 RepID=UPI00159D5F44|nr:LysR substrate-binding domain-containing protein [Arthrobacter sp. SDTb3-6]NVM99911.1 LysR family transcriptional regulator [Arthrobacter sp. SDTb3-6]